MSSNFFLKKLGNVNCNWKGFEFLKYFYSERRFSGIYTFAELAAFLTNHFVSRHFNWKLLTMKYCSGILNSIISLDCEVFSQISQDVRPWYTLLVRLAC